MRVQPRQALIVLAVLTVVAAGCSSTASDEAAPSKRTTTIADDATGPSGGDPAATVDETGTTAAPGTAAGRATTRRTSSGGAAQPGRGGDPPNIDRSKFIPGNASGVTDSEIVIGVETLTNLGATYAAVGFDSNAIPTDQEIRAIVQAIFDHLNAKGGLAGRKAVPLIHFTDIANGTHNSRAQESCSFFTEDHDVFAVIAAGNSTDALPRCLAKKRTPLLDDNNAEWPYDDADLAELSPYLYLPTKLSISRYGVYIDGLKAQGFFDGGTVGLLRYDLPNHVRARDRVLKPALARHGIEIEDEFAFTPAQSVGDLSRAGAEANSAVLRFRNAGIDRIIYLPTAWVVDFVFPSSAESQGYRPRHGLNTSSGLQGSWVANAPDAQLRNSTAVGWKYSVDRGNTRENPSNPLWAECVEVMRKRGLNTGGAHLCTPLLMLQQGLSRAPEASPAGLRTGLDAVGTAPYSTTSFTTTFKPGRADGPAAARHIAYDQTCDCFDYKGGEVPIP